MVKQDAVAGINAVGLTVVDGNPVGVHFSDGIRATWVKWRGFFLRGLLHQAVKLGGGGLVELGLFFESENANGFENTQGADAIGIGRVFRGFKADRHMAHGGQVIDFIGLRLLNDADQIGGVC